MKKSLSILLCLLSLTLSGQDRRASFALADRAFIDAYHKAAMSAPVMVGKKSIIKSPGGLWYERWDPTVKSPLNRVVIVCIGGFGEWGSYTAADMNAEVSRVAERNGFAQDAAAGEELPFIVIAPLATGKKNADGNMQADHTLITKEIGNIVKSIDADYRFIGGLSQGGQTTAGFLFQAKNGTELKNNAASSFVNADVFDGFFMFAGQAPVPTDPCAFPQRYIFMVHATGDASISVDNSFTMMRLANSCGAREHKVYSNYYQKWTKPVSYIPQLMPIDAINKLIVIPGGGHSTSWNEAYNWSGPVGSAGYEFRKWIEYIAQPKEQETKDIPGVLILRGSQVIGKFENGQEVILK